MKKLLCRENEIKLLDQIVKSNSAEFLAIYGRRRIGKTFLVNQYVSDKKHFFFSVTGLKDGSKFDQLSLFSRKIGDVFLDGEQLAPHSEWMDALYDLTDRLKSIPKKQKIVLFFDELPWLASSRSGFIQALDHIWNTQWSLMPNLKLIVCGSAASWMIDNLIHAKGGLHNRVNHKLNLKPFTLKQSKRFLKQTGHKLSDKQVLDLYIALGGVPFYLTKILKNTSVIQNIQKLCFDDQAFLQTEFEEIFRSLFLSADAYQEIVQTLCKYRYGLSRKALLTKLKQSSGGGTFEKRIEALEASGFIQSFIPYQKKRDVFYRVVDEYSLFYFKWILPHKKKLFTKSHWHDQAKTPSYISWAGYAFEGVCMKHFDEVRRALGIEHIGCMVGNWRHVTNSAKPDSGAQVDLLFDRDDDAISVCEVRYSSKQYAFNKEEAQKLDKKIDCFADVTKTNKQIFTVLITTVGLKSNLYSADLIDQVVCLKDLMSD